MQLEHTTAVVRPRNDWEAIDLGVTLAQANARRVYFAWFAGAVPVAAIALAAAHLTGRFWLAFAVFWWLKPLTDRLPLHVLSRALFGEHLSTGAILRALPRALMTNATLSALTLGRLNPLRSYTLPVTQLERLRRGAWYRRSQLLMRDTSGVAFMLTFVCLLFVNALVLTVIALVSFLTPEWLVVDVDPFGATTRASVFDAAVLHGTFFLVVVAEAIIEPIYVSCGFTLYLNRRTRLEGWDIELAFRRLAARARGAFAASAVLLAAWCTFGGIDNAAAATATPEPVRHERGFASFAHGTHEAEAVRAAVDRVLSHPDFDPLEPATHWTPRSGPDERPDAFDRFDWLGNIGALLAHAVEIVIWAAVAIAAALAFRYREMWLGALRRARRAAEPLPVGIASTDRVAIRLPDDIAGHARQLWTDGDREGALSLLYRGALARAVRLHGANIGPSDTEQACMAAVERAATASVAGYFTALARSWQRLAYGAIAPDDEAFATLAGAFDTHFGGTA